MLLFIEGCSDSHKSHKSHEPPNDHPTSIDDFFLADSKSNMSTIASQLLLQVNSEKSKMKPPWTRLAQSYVCGSITMRKHIKTGKVCGYG
jgi:hypothetical protein